MVIVEIIGTTIEIRIYSVEKEVRLNGRKKTT
jgi:hypothetical protein